MFFNCIKSIGLLGYIIVVNDEIHSRQIKMLDDVLIRYEIIDDDKIIRDILNDKDEKIAFNDCLIAFQQENRKTKEFIYRICFQLAVIDNDNFISDKPDSKEESVLRSLENYMWSINISLQRKEAISEINNNLYVNTYNETNSFNLDFASLLSVASNDYVIYESGFRRIFSECNIYYRHVWKPS